MILITQTASEKYVKTLIDDRDEIYPVILEIPSKEKAYDPAKDSVMQRAHRLLYGSEIQWRNKINRFNGDKIRWMNKIKRRGGGCWGASQMY